MEVTFSINGLDLHKKLSTYTVTKDITYRNVITTLDEIEHPYPGAQRVVITFSLLPLTDVESAELYAALRDLVIPVTYTNPYTNADEQKRLRVVSGIEDVFLLLSVDGKCRYKVGQIQLREL